MIEPKITPPSELVRHWSRFQGDTDPEALWFRIANEAAQWGADQELEACIDWMIRMGYWGDDGKAIPALRSARRSEPPSLKEQALEALDSCSCDEADSWKLIRRALEQLPEGA
jgi:hypothetical protein